MNLYASKRAVNARLEPVVAFLAARRVSPDALTLGAVPVAALGGALLLLSPDMPWLLAVVPLLAGVRLILNLLDGQLARLTGRTHRRGELYNEVGDRLADALFIAPVAFLAGAQPETVLIGLGIAILASYVGITARAAGGERIYRGILSKPGRMVLLSVFCLAVLVLGPGGWWAFGPLLLAGASLTFIERLYVAYRRLA
jgi:phosphatidylglycerophosphate synthase